MEDSVPAEPTPQSASNGAQLTPEELVAKAIAPVKPHYLRPPPVRSSSCNNAKDAAPSTAKNDDADKAPPSSLVKEKKSKRQLKRERRQVNMHSQHFVFFLFSST